MTLLKPVKLTQLETNQHPHGQPHFLISGHKLLSQWEYCLQFADVINLYRHWSVCLSGPQTHIVARRLIGFVWSTEVLNAVDCLDLQTLISG